MDQLTFLWEERPARVSASPDCEKDSPMHAETLRLSFLVFAAILMTSITAAAQWKEYPMPQLGFIVEFPAAPAASMGNYKTQMLVPSAPVHLYSVRDGDELYMADVICLP